VNWVSGGRTQQLVDVLTGLKAKGVEELVWDHMSKEFDRIDTIKYWHTSI
jgi:hypothetical protein